MWRHQVERLESVGHAVYPVDLPGHGGRMGERFTLDAAVDTIGSAVTRAAEESGAPAFLAGFSLGAYLALEYAGRGDAPIRGVLAASCGTVPYRWILAPYRAGANVIARLPDRGRSMNEFFVRRFVPAPGADDVLAGGAPLDVMDDVLRELRRLTPLESVRRIDVPIWFVNGRFDHFRLQERAFLRAAPNGRLVHVPNANHMVSVTNPDAFTGILLDALTETA